MRTKQLLVLRNSRGTVALYQIGAGKFALRHRIHGRNRTDRTTFACERTAFREFSWWAQKLAYSRLPAWPEHVRALASAES